MTKEEQILELEYLLKRYQNCINHARLWIKTLDPEFRDQGMYKKVSEEISEYFKNKS